MFSVFEVGQRREKTTLITLVVTYTLGTLAVVGCCTRFSRVASDCRGLFIGAFRITNFSPLACDVMSR